VDAMFFGEAIIIENTTYTIDDDWRQLPLMFQPAKIYIY
jgi:hypothetical protein